MSTDNPNGAPNRPVSSSECELSLALAQLQMKLLDLSRRNKLINFKHTVGKSLQFVEGQPADIYQKLVEANNKATITILGLPEPTRHDWMEHNGRLQRPDPREWARAKGIPTIYDIPVNDGSENHSDVRALMYPDDLAKHCRKIERESMLAIEETGANMLFLVLGFLEFPDQRDSDKTLTAPLVSIPVTFLKKGVPGIQSFSLQHTGDDISENLSLREKFKNDFGITLPALDEDKIDVEQYFDEISNIIKTNPGFSLKRRVSLCLLSFTNMLLVRDLDPTQWPQQGGLVDHPIVREVLLGNSGEASPGLGVAEEHSVEEGPGLAIPLVYDADSSQHSALVDVLTQKKNLVIEGPPGTGKSQTITNLIAACLAEGKKVLFVAEKMAALEVVKNRLSMAGLDPFVLELHSNKTNKKHVLEEIGKRITFTSSPPSDLQNLLRQLESYRHDLKSYTDLINSIVYNSFGLTLHQVIWKTERHRSSLNGTESRLTQVTIADASQISEFELSRRMDCLNHLGLQYESINGFDDDATFWGFYPERIIPGDEVRLSTFFASSLEWVQQLINDTSTLSEILESNLTGLTLEYARTQANSLTQLLALNKNDLPLHLVPCFFQQDKSGENTKQLLMEFEDQIRHYQLLWSLVKTTLNDESSITKTRIEELKVLSKTAESLGVKLGDLASLRSLTEKLNQATDKLIDATDFIKDFLQNKGIAFDGTRQRLKQLERFTKLIIDAPEEHLHLQTPGLAMDGALQAIEALSKLQAQWIGIQNELEESLYIDSLPAQESIKQATLTLREGNVWYRIFQSRWRSAISLHKSLQRAKQKVPSKVRLVQLEKLIQMLQLKVKWKSDPAWLMYLGFPCPVDPLAFDKYVALTKWNYDVRLALEEVQSTAIDLASFTPDQARTLRREFTTLNNTLVSANIALENIDTEFNQMDEFVASHTVEKAVSITRSFSDALEAQLEWLELDAIDKATYSEVVVGCEAALERKKIKSIISRNTEIKRLLGDMFKGVDTDVGGALEALAFGQAIDELNLSAQIKASLRRNHPIEACQEIKNALNEVLIGLSAVAELERELKSFGEFDLGTWIGPNIEDDLLTFSEALYERLDNAVEDAYLLIPWSLYVARRREACGLGLLNFVEMLELKQLRSSELADAYAYCTYTTIVRKAFRNVPQLGGFTGLKHNQIREEFKRLDKEIIHLRGHAIAAHCARFAYVPGGRNGARVNDKTEMRLLNLLIPQQRPRMPVRKILLRAQGAIQALKPCFMMGPQAVAQYLTPGAIKFDLVIMDEASQLRPEEAIGAIARGGQLVVVGDPKQLPPTSFFSRMGQTSDDDDQYTATDAESILDVCTAQFQPTRALRWHYRSQHHSLIAFSNHHFYRGNLVIFPSPYGQSEDLGVRATYLADAVYENQTNLREAKRVVDAVVDHIMRRPNDSVGVVTLNIKQKDLIAELIEDRLITTKGADDYREHWRTEGQPFFVKNLENVQGDERDAIIISTTFGRPAGSSAVRQNFGPISRQDGWRRLNVLFTRAKKSIAVYTSLRPEDIVVDGTTPVGTKALRNYLEYVRSGSLTVEEETGREPDSDFEISVMNMLQNRGYSVTPQLGVAGYRIDLAVKHPDAPGSYLAAVECDGRSYHSALSVRDRDRIRQEILESLGWRGRIWRIWSTDWFRTPRQEADKLFSFLDDLRKNWKPKHYSGESWIEEGQRLSHMESGQAAPISPVSSHPAPNAQSIEKDREAVRSVLIESEDDLVVEVGDIVKYVDVSKPRSILTVHITATKDDFANGLVSESRPLAQTLLGAVVGDEVTLNLRSAASRVFRITEIKRA